MAQYIGKFGTHFNQDVFQKWGFDRTTLDERVKPYRPKMNKALSMALADKYKMNLLKLYT